MKITKKRGVFLLFQAFLLAGLCLFIKKANKGEYLGFVAKMTLTWLDANPTKRI